MGKNSNNEVVKIPGGSEAILANYTEQVVEDYKENPLIETLPDVLSLEDSIDKLSLYPPFSPNERELSAHHRYHCIQRLFRYLQPSDKHLEIEQNISRTIRQGYLHRSPLDKNYAIKLQEIHKMPKDDLIYEASDYKNKTVASGFTIIGISGIGKTTAVERVLSSYPQVIVHSEYKGEHLNLYQIPYLKLDCPFDASIKGLCANFFSEVDKLLGTRYYDKNFSSKITVDSMIIKMAQIASLHCIGVLVVDEIQHLSTAKCGGAEKMLNFFVNLVNTIGVPVTLIGTPKSAPILKGEFRQGRRGTGQGTVLWERMNNGSDWEMLVEGMWDYQWTAKEVKLTKELINTLYEETQGIVDIAIKLYALAQITAISTGKETITPQMLKSIVNKYFKLVKPALDALKTGDKDKIAMYGDITSIQIDEFISEQTSSLSKSDKNVNYVLNQKKKEKYQSQASIAEKVISKLLELDIAPKSAEKAVEEAIDLLGEEEKEWRLLREALKIATATSDDEPDKKSKTKPNKSKNKSKENNDSNDLRKITEKAKKEKKSAYEELKEAGYIKNPHEELII